MLFKGDKKKHLDFLDILLEAKARVVCIDWEEAPEPGRGGGGVKVKIRQSKEKCILDSQDDSGVGMTDGEIQAEVDTFMFEGHDTTASGQHGIITILSSIFTFNLGIAWTLYTLAKYSDHQKKCREEVDALFDQKEMLEMWVGVMIPWFTFKATASSYRDDVKSLAYLGCCIKESLRLFPPVPITGRCLDQATDIGGYKMPKGTNIWINNYVVHHHPEVWEDPEVSVGKVCGYGWTKNGAYLIKNKIK